MPTILKNNEFNQVLRNKVKDYFQNNQLARRGGIFNDR